MRQFVTGMTDGLLLDDVRDMQFVVDHQEKLHQRERSNSRLRLNRARLGSGQLCGVEASSAVAGGAV